MRGRPEFPAARCSLRLALRSSFWPIAPATAEGTAERSASSIAQSACTSSSVSTRIRRAGVRPSSSSPWPCGWPQSASPLGEMTKSIGPSEGMRPRSAAANPKAAGKSPSLSGRTSWSAPPTSPPRGRCASITGSPKENTHSSIAEFSSFGRSWRKRSTISARLRSGANRKAIDGFMRDGFMRDGFMTQQTRPILQKQRHDRVRLTRHVTLERTNGAIGPSISPRKIMTMRDKALLRRPQVLE